ncbi:MULTISPECIES: isoaspartyl peptidase/L-asparaginase [unclassified Duganella]|uniref:isoaspartyl peptidase/L-asparaginase n=1 Tax=unclassified Duganella TaxID=2636909 RepID=UPI0013EEE826|nr:MULTISPECIES: isoaspartyl peptidase/L-asparaginase [unclassified Duganella]
MTRKARVRTETTRCVADAIGLIPQKGRFNAGTGVALGLDGVTVEMDAAIMDTRGRLSAVAALRAVKNPILVMADASERIYCSGGGELGEGLSVDIVDCALTRLAPGGRLLMYTCVAINGGNHPFRDRIGGMLNAAGLIWDYHELDPDVFGGELGSEKYQQTERIAAVVLSAARCRRAVV